MEIPENFCRHCRLGQYKVHSTGWGTCFSALQPVILSFLSELGYYLLRRFHSDVGGYEHILKFFEKILVHFDKRSEHTVQLSEKSVFRLFKSAFQLIKKSHNSAFRVNKISYFRDALR